MELRWQWPSQLPYLLPCLTHPAKALAFRNPIGTVTTAVHQLSFTEDPPNELPSSTRFIQYYFFASTKKGCTKEDNLVDCK
jgi:hypothetical protein